MNLDPLEERLRSLRPGVMPEVLLERLADPPAVPTSRRGKIIRIAFAATATAAACAALWFRPAPPEEPASAPVLASTRTSRVTEVTPVSVITDAASRPWKFVRVNWVEEDMLVSAANPSAVQMQDYHATIIPVAVTFD